MNKLGIQNISKKYWLVEIVPSYGWLAHCITCEYINNSGNLAEESLYQKPYSQGWWGYAR